MNHDRFDGLARLLAFRASRRGLAPGVTGGTVAVLVGAVPTKDTAARKRKKRKKSACPPCGECRQCRKGSCVPLAEDTPCGQCGRCLQGACANALDRASLCGECATCEAGRCRDKTLESPCGLGGIGLCDAGVCYTPPFCDPFPDPCTSGSFCCSGACCKIFGTEVQYCCPGDRGDRCYADADCGDGLTCLAYRCAS